ncbi:TonB-dependent receptor [Novosphingobium resinovorum]|uniref:TonB-dependent receptor n=1 Tax=Novosphingobium resinovorum TaxID=158500 RepID=UPI002ED5F5A3|nr:TonB-dependent receptor [Novosphingobium resinovorum]
MLKTVLATGAAFVALATAFTPAYADEAPAAAKDASGDDIIVTGSTRAERRFDVSYAVNTLSQDDVEKIAPVNLSDLIGQLPGFQTEITGGEVQNIYRLRGLPSDGSFVSFQQDGMTLFQENEGYFWRGDSLIRYDLMTDHMEVVRGGPAPIYSSNSGAIINQITVTGNDTPRGKAQVTLGDSGLYRADAYQAGPINSNTYYAIGGFLRYNDGYRDNGFPTDKGGQIRANIKHDLDNGSIKFSVNYVNDHNVFYLPIPVSDPTDPSVSLNKYINYFTGTLNTPELRNVNLQYRDGAGNIVSRNSDLSDGRHTQMLNLGLRYDANFGDWLISAKAGYTQGKLDFAALYSTTNPSDGDTFASSYLSAAQTAFGSNVASLGYVYAGTSTAYDPYSASGLVMQAQYRDIHSKYYSGQADLSAARTFHTGLGDHDLKLGLYGSLYGMSQDVIYQNYLMEVSSKPKLLDLVAYSATGEVLGSVTDNGVLNYTTTLSKGDSDAKMWGLYGNDTWTVTSGLKIDGGIRYEKYYYDGWAALTEQVDLGDATTLADNTTRGFTGATVTRHYAPDSLNWTAGVNYDLSGSFGLYGRASHLEQPFGISASMSASTPTTITTKVNQFELGLKMRSGRSYLYVTGFVSNFDPLNASFLAYDEETGQNDVTVPFVGKAVIKGIEFDGHLEAAFLPGFTIDGALTVSDPKYKDFQNSDGADPALAEGNQIVREPKIYGNIRPGYSFAVGDSDVSVYGRYTYMGKRYVDVYNNTALPAYGTVGAGVTVKHGSWNLQVVGDNLFNAHGLTEGNTRTDSLAGQGSAEAIYGRPIYGRNFRLVIGKSW